jgi:ligand-binding sensor domain-containing protein
MTSGSSPEQDQRIDYSRDEGVSHTNEAAGYKPIFFESMIRDEMGNLWMSSNGSGVWRFDGKEMKHFPVKTGDSWLISIYQDRKGAIMLATDSAGVFQYDGKEFAPYKPKV